VFFGELHKSLGQPSDSTPDIPSPKAGLDVRNDGKGGGGEFGVASIICGEALKELLKVGIGIKMAGSGGEGTEGAHGGQITEKGEEYWVKNLLPNLGGVTFKESRCRKFVEALGMTEKTGGVGPGPEELIFIKLISVGPAVAAVWGKGFQGKIVLPLFAQIGEEAVENLGHGEQGGAEIPTKAVHFSFGDFPPDHGVFFEESDATTGTS
jgi:hypothetical protein